MDSIFRKVHGASSGWFTVVKAAHDEPRRYGKNGELLIAYEETDEHARRMSSVVSASDKTRAQRLENLEHADLQDGVEKGYGKEIE